MPLINKLLRVLPKKRVDIVEMDRKLNSVKIETVKTVKKETMTPEYLNQGKSDTTSDHDGMIHGEYEILEREIMPEKIICPDCGGLTLEGLEFCDKCGGDLTNT